MKVEFWCDSGANIYSCREKVIDLVEEWGFSEEECKALTDDDLHKLAMEHAWESGLDIGMRKLEE